MFQVILNLTSSAIFQLERTKPTRPVKSTHGTTFPKDSKKQRTTSTLLHGFKHTTQQTLEVYQQQQQQQQCPGTSDAH
jgi:hypothetical protein